MRLPADQIFKFRLPTTELTVHAGVLNNTWQTSEATKVVRRVTQAFLHEGFGYDKFLNDIAILKVRSFAK
jgi:hypothetical protein